jgi:CheY-like chemotaxis protein
MLIAPLSIPNSSRRRPEKNSFFGCGVCPIDRWEPVRRLRNDPHTHDIPIIGMSAHALESEREQAIATGCDEFDAKPIEFGSLVATIRRVLAHRK